jgi:hypothetical protein
LEDIVIIDDKFIITNSKYLLPIDEENIIFYKPIDHPYFSNPELFVIKELPSRIHYRTSYYSLGALVVFCLFNNYLLVANEIKSDQEIEKIIYPIYNTKIYWFLKRCFEKESIKRILLLI